MLCLCGASGHLHSAWDSGPDTYSCIPPLRLYRIPWCLQGLFTAVFFQQGWSNTNSWSLKVRTGGYSIWNGMQLSFQNKITEKVILMSWYLLHQVFEFPHCFHQTSLCFSEMNPRNFHRHLQNVSLRFFAKCFRRGISGDTCIFKSQLKSCLKFAKFQLFSSVSLSFLWVGFRFLVEFEFSEKMMVSMTFCTKHYSGIQDVFHVALAHKNRSLNKCYHVTQNCLPHR